MRHLRWQALIAILGMGLIGGLLAGQGRSVAVRSVPAEGGLYAEALVGAPRALNPLLDRANPVDRDLGRLIFSGLTRFDASGRPAPDLANWLVSGDSLTYTFILRPNLQWHDGRPLTSRDVAFTVELLQSPAYPGPADVSGLWQSVEVEVVDDQTIRFRLPEPFAPFLDYTAFGLLPEHLLAGVAAAELPELEFNLQPVGSGPFRFQGWVVADGRLNGVVLAAAAANYPQRPLLDQLQFNFYPDLAAALAAYRRGEVLGLPGLEQGQLAEALKDPQLGLYTALMPRYTLIFLNTRSTDLPFFQEKKVRQALLAGLNRQAMVSRLLDGQAVVAASPILPGSWAYHPGLAPAVYNPEQAVQLLESAGWLLPAGSLAGSEDYVRQKKGVALAFNLLAPDDPLHLALAQAARDTWAPLGVRVTVQPVSPQSLRDDHLEPRAFQAALADFDLSATPDPDPYPLWHETQVESGQNYSGFSDRVTSELLEQARITLDIGQRARLYRSFQSRFADQVPALLLYYPVYNYALDLRVNGVRLGPLTEPSDRFNTLGEWYIVTRRVVVGEEGVPAAATAAP